MPPLRCGRCQYDLSGLVRRGDTLTCPECGNEHRIITPTFQKISLRANCRRCGYPLAGLDRADGSAICPECGTAREASDPDTPGVMPNFARALALIVLPMLALWGAARMADIAGRLTSLASLLLLTAATAWGFAAPVIIPKLRARRYGAGPRLVFDEVAVGYVSTILAAFIFGLLLVLIS